MRTILASIIVLGISPSIHASIREDYSTSCSVNAGEASASITSNESDLTLRGPVRITVFDWNHRAIEEHTIETTVNTRPSYIGRLVAFDVSLQATACRVDISDAKLWVDGVLVSERQVPAPPAVVEHRIVYPEPRPHVHNEVFFSGNGFGARYCNPCYEEQRTSRVVVVEREHRPRLRRVERVIVERERPIRRIEKVIVRPEPRPRGQTRIEVQLPLLRVRS